MNTEIRHCIEYVKDILSCAVAGALLCGVVVLLSYDPDSYYSLALKDARLETLESPRMVIIGGSGAAISVNSGMLEEKTGYPVVNMGSSAGLGIRFMFESVLSRLRSGDVVLYFMEPSVVQNLLYPEGASLLATLHPNPTYLRHLVWPPDKHTFHSFVDVVRKFPAWLQQKARYIVVVKMFPETFAHPPSVSEVLYHAHNFDMYGDVNSAIVGDAHMTKEKLLLSTAGQISESYRTENIEYLKHQIGSLESQGIRVLVLWPAYAESLYDAHPAYVEQRNRDIIAALGAEHVVGTADSFVLEDSLFLDESSHVTYVGRDLYTEKMLPYLITSLGRK
jgi:hypothetical protein